MCANYPYDGYDDMSMAVTGVRNPSPDDAAFVHLAKTYAAAHKFMSQSVVRGAVRPARYGRAACRLSL